MSSPVVHRGVVLGTATTERGALNVAARHLPRTSREHVTAKRGDWWQDTGSEFTFLGAAWHVGVRLS